MRGSYQCIDTPCPPNYQRDPATGWTSTPTHCLITWIIRIIIKNCLVFFHWKNICCCAGSVWKTVHQTTWSVHSVHTPWSTSCCLFPLVLQPIRTWSGWWPTLRMESCTPEPHSRWWMRTSCYLLPYEMRTWRGCCSPSGLCESHIHTAWRSEPSLTVKMEALSTRPPSSSTSLSLPTPTESTLNGEWGKGAATEPSLLRAAPLMEQRGVNEWVWSRKEATSSSRLRKTFEIIW